MKKGLLTILILFVSYAFASSTTVSAHAYSYAFTRIKISPEHTTIRFAIDDLSVIESVNEIDSNQDYFLDQLELEAKSEQVLQWINQHLIVHVNEVPVDMEFVSLTLHKELPGKVDFHFEHEIAYDEVMLPDASVVIATIRIPPLEPLDRIGFRDTFYKDSVLTENYGNFINVSVGEKVVNASALYGNTRDFNYLHAGSEYGKKRVVDWTRFLFLGSEHILLGFDHLLFLFTLVMLRMRMREYVKIITSFTIAHSLTLALAVTGILSLPSKFVETMIAISIIYVAVENLLFPRHVKHRWWITFIFGLIHGLGFAEILIRINLPRDQLVQSLLSFNIGIELTQIVLVILLFPFLRLWHRSKRYPRTFVIMNILGIIAGLMWLLQRLLQT